VDVVIVVISSLNDLVICLHNRYPYLYKHIFAEEMKKDVPRITWVIDDFMIVHNIDYSTGDTYSKIWEYIVDNEDKHDWWML